MSIPAGRAWCAKYATGKTTRGLRLPFRRCVQLFIFCLEREHGCTVRINATDRPANRAWLMHYVWRIVREGQDPATVPVRSGIDIEWTREGAAEMFEVYDLVARPSLVSRHIDGLAIDMTIEGWTGTRAELEALGRSYGVHPLRGDPVHWSVDGH